MTKISLNYTFDSRLKQLRKQGLNPQWFLPSSFDWIRDSFKVCQENNHRFSDDSNGSLRLVSDRNFLETQIKILRSRLRRFSEFSFRYLVDIPDNLQDINQLRDALVEIQLTAGMKKVFLPVGINENQNHLGDYLNSLDCEFVLVMKMKTHPTLFKQVMTTYLDKSEEIVLFYDEIKGNGKNYRFLLNLCLEGAGEKLHLTNIPLPLNSFGKTKFLSTFFVCNGLGSVGFQDEKIPGYILKNLDRTKPKKSFSEKVSVSSWTDLQGVAFERAHPEGCQCFSDFSCEGLLSSVGISETITFHNLENLSHQYDLISRNILEKQRVLDLEPMIEIRQAIQSA